jgi:hypothetical protein
MASSYQHTDRVATSLTFGRIHNSRHAVRQGRGRTVTGMGSGWTTAAPGCTFPAMLSDQWFPDGIVLKGARTGVVEKIPEPYSFESAVRLAKNYSKLWLEPIEWWGIGSEDQPHYVAVPQRLEPRRRRSASGAR